MRGIWTALVTPFDQNLELDIPAFKKILQKQAAAKVSGVVVCGSTAESPTLSESEKKTLILTALQELKGTGVKVLAGTGSNNTAETLTFSSWASEQGVDGIMLVTPYYNKPSQAGMEAHFLAVANAVHCEVMLYNVPGRAVVSLTAETIARLAKHPNIRSLKEATGNTAFTSEILHVLSQNQCSMDILSGDDATFLPLLAAGAVGDVSVVSNLIPKVMVDIQNSAEGGRLEEATKMHRYYYPIFRDFFIESNPVPVKYAMELAGLCKSHVRMPLAPLSPQNAEKIRATLKLCGLPSGSA